MCIALSLSKSCRDLLGVVDIPVVIETIQYLSTQRKVLIAFDLVIRNRASGDKPAWLLLTHIDDVEGQLATENWFPRDEKDSDARMRLLRRIYGKHWDIDPTARSLRYTDPIESLLGEPVQEQAIEAYALSYRPDIGAGTAVPTARPEVDPTLIDPRSRCFDTIRLQPVPEMGLQLTANTENPTQQPVRPYSTFCLGPIPAGTSAFARMTLVIQGAAYGRLVQPEEGAPFEIVSGRLIREQIRSNMDSEAARTPPGSNFKRFFDENLNQGLDPTRYQIIIMQPLEGDHANHLVRFRLASPTISELPIADHRARDRALWFNAWSQEFRLVLRYEPNQESANSEARRLRFSDRLSAGVRAL